MKALVTGAGSGLGKALADELERTGWTVARSDRAPGLIPLDVRDPAAFRQVVEDLGDLDLLVNNAGVCSVGEAQSLDDEDWSTVLDVNLHGTINGIRAAYPGMVKRRRGAILNVASLAGLIGFPGCMPYAASKWAVVGMTLSLRAEARHYGVKASAFCPGFLKTNIFDNARWRGLDSARMQQRLPLPMLPVEGGARAALAGLRKNQGIITYPFYASVLTLPMRLNLAFAEFFHGHGYKKVLQARLDP